MFAKVVIVGCSTSGCIRASALGALQNGFRPVVVRECVGDRTKEVHEANLHDIRAKIGDVMTKSFVLDRLQSLVCSVTRSMSINVSSAAATIDKSSASGHGTPFNGNSGFGNLPCLLVVDFCNAYTTEGNVCYCPDPEVGVVKAVAESVPLLEAARQAAIPIIFTRVTFTPGTGDGGIFTQKVPMLNTWTEDNCSTHIVESLKPIPGETVMVKKYPSAFFGTPLAAQLTAKKVDTVVTIGCSTSGCIRATALDAMQHGFKAVVVRECVGDRTKAVHDANLHDIQAKIGDVMSKQQVLEALSNLGARANGS